MTIAFKINSLITLPQAGEFGTGKIVALGENSIQVAFPFHPSAVPGRPYISWFSLEKAKVELAAEQNDPRFEAVSGDKPVRRSTGAKRAPKAPAVSHSFEEARAYFMKVYPQGFNDPAYVSEGKKAERAIRLAARAAFDESLGQGKGRALLNEGNLDELKNRLDLVLEKAGFLHVLERLAFKKALKESPQAKAYFEALFTLVEQPAAKSEAFENLAQAVGDLAPKGQPSVAKWPVVTLPLYLARGDFMFLKPTATKQAAGRIGVDLNYDARVNWKTYESLLEMGRAMLEKLKDSGARDFTDVLGFIAVSEDKNISGQ